MTGRRHSDTENLTYSRGCGRKRPIKELLQSKPFISLHELEKSFPDVSSMTLRRDIEYFEKQGEAIKVRGGARSMKFITTSMEDAFNLRLGENTSAKDKIARCALTMINPAEPQYILTEVGVGYRMSEEAK